MDFSKDALIEWLKVHADSDFSGLLGTTTIPAHQGVGSSTFDITPIASIPSSSCLTFGCRGKAMFRGVESASGLASGVSLISNSSPRFPNPVNRLGNCWVMLPMVCNVCSLETRFRAVIAGSPSRLF